MKQVSDKLLRTVGIELAWLLGSWAFSFVVVGTQFGKYSGNLDIQMHNTYFVLPVAVLATLFFLVFTPLMTSARVLAGRGRHVPASITLAALSGVWLLIILAVGVAWLLKLK